MSKLIKLRRELADCQSLLAHKNDTANTFMEQVRKLQSQIALKDAALKRVLESIDFSDHIFDVDKLIAQCEEALK